MGQEREEVSSWISKTTVCLGATFPLLAHKFATRHPLAAPFSFCMLPCMKKSLSRTFLHDLETLSCLGLNVPVFEQFLAVPCLYGVVMVNSESSEDGGSAKLLGKELLTSQDSEGLEIGNLGHRELFSLLSNRRATPVLVHTDCCKLYRSNGKGV